MAQDYMDLITLQNGLGRAVEGAFPERVWVRAEIAGLKVNAAGHCYLELAQTGGGRVLAQVRAVIWRSRYPVVSQYFAAATGAPLSAGIEVLARVQVSYHEVYGMTLTIDEIDPSFTLGEQQRLRKETLDRLEKEGLLHRQKQLRLPLLPYRLAVISAEGAAGYGDFLRHLTENDYGYAYRVDLFPAVMQGTAAPVSMQEALEAVRTAGEPYDAVLILRGGGSELDLACFDDYGLAAAIARFPVPVFTAIGHDREHGGGRPADHRVGIPPAHGFPEPVRRAGPAAGGDAEPGADRGDGPAECGGVPAGPAGSEDCRDGPAGLVAARFLAGPGRTGRADGPRGRTQARRPDPCPPAGRPAGLPDRGRQRHPGQQPSIHSLRRSGDPAK